MGGTEKLDEPEILRDALTASGFDAAAIMARMQDREVKDRLIADTAMFVCRGGFGSPTFFVGDTMYFGRDRLRDVEEAIQGIA